MPMQLARFKPQIYLVQIRTKLYGIWDGTKTGL